MAAQLSDEIVKIAAILAVAQEQVPAAPNPQLHTHLGYAREALTLAARQAANPWTRPDGLVRLPGGVIVTAVHAGVGSGCAYLAAVVLDLPRWLSVIVVIAGLIGVSFATVPVMRRLDAWVRGRPWPRRESGEQVVPNEAAREDLGLVLTRARAHVGQLALRRLDRPGAPVRSGSVALWVRQHDRLLSYLVSADVHLCGAQLAWSGRIAGGRRPRRDAVTAGATEAADVIAQRARRIAARAEAAALGLQIARWRSGSAEPDEALVPLHQASRHLVGAADALEPPGLITYQPATRLRFAVVSTAALMAGVTVLGLLLPGRSMAVAVAALVAFMLLLDLGYQRWVRWRGQRGAAEPDPDLPTTLAGLATDIDELLDSLRTDDRPHFTEAAKRVSMAAFWIHLARPVWPAIEPIPPLM